MNFHRLSPFAVALALACGATGAAHATNFSFNANPFAGSAANPNDGIRTVVGGNEIQLPSFDVYADQFQFSQAVFNVSGDISFANSLGANLPDTFANVIVLRDSPTPFNAGSAANVIAANVDLDGAGFFVYWNSTLNVNRLVYSTNLNVNTADLSILARINSPTGQEAIDALPTFTAANFAVTPVPEPSTYAMMLAGLMGVVAVSRRSKKAAV